MGFLSDLLPAFKKHSITLKEKRNESGEIVSFIFKGEESITWKAGQHGMFLFDKKILPKGGTKSFSASSSPGEGQIRITTRVSQTSPSPYKKALQQMKVGETITMRGPFGPFHVENPEEPMVFIAGGLGIAPFRSLIQDIYRIKGIHTATIDLLYIDSSEAFIFKEELDRIGSEFGSFNVTFIKDRHRLKEEITKAAQRRGNGAQFYISGSHPFIKEVKAQLKEQGIQKKQMKNEILFGYM